MKKVIFITTHPIQYNAPLFKLIAKRNNIEIKVFYTWSQAKERVFDPGFGKERQWDIPLLEGYDYEFLDNVSKKPGSNHYGGIVNPNILNRIKDFKPNAILVFGWNFKSHLQVLRFFKNKIPIWFRGDSTLLDENQLGVVKKIFRRLALRWVFKHVDKAFYVGRANKEYFLKHGINEHQLSFAPHAIDNNRFYDINEKYSSRAKIWRNELSIQDNDVVFLFAGKFESKKNPNILINAFKKISKENIHLILVGNGILEKKLKSETVTHKNIHFLDFQNQSNMPIVYRLGNVFVLPSKGPGETWGLAINEAMASGIPVVASNKCGCNLDLIKDGYNGFVFDAENEEMLTRVLGNFLSGNYDLKKMGLNALNLISEWNYENICSSIENELFKTQ